MEGKRSYCRKCQSESDKIRYLANRYNNIAKSKKWKKDNPVKRKEYRTNWKLLNKDKVAKYSSSYRKRLINAGNIEFIKSLLKTLKLSKLNCTKCKKLDYLTIDHIIPLSKGGTNEINNIQYLCIKCNCLKSNNYMLNDLYRNWTGYFI